MTSQERLSVKAAWIKLSAYYQVQLQDHVLEMYAEDVEGLAYNAVMSALTEYRRNPKNVKVPLPASIRAIVKPELSDEVLALDATARVTFAVRKFGWPNPSEARLYVGELAWHVVERSGGWKYICENLGLSMSLGTFQAQFRESAKAQLQLSRAGRLDSPPVLERSKNVTQLIESAIRSIEPPKKGD